MTERELLESGDYFFCKACLSAVPYSEQSNNPDYCRECNTIIREERKAVHRSKDFWARDNCVFVTNGRGWIVGPDAESYCIGPVDAKGYPVNPSSEPSKASHSADIPVTKIPDEESVGEQILTPIYVTPKRRGRPVKNGKVTRMTEWRRRQKPQQAVML